MLIVDVDVFDEAAVERAVEDFVVEHHFAAFEVQDIHGMRHHVARMAAAEFAIPA